MQKFLINTSAFLCLTLLGACSKSFDQSNPNCSGKDRWDVKTLTDPGLTSVNFTPLPTTVSDLIQIQPQVTSGASTPRFGVEFNTYTLSCRIREYKLSSDGDYQMVLMDLNDPNKTMIAEIPDPSCDEVKTSTYLNQFVQARKDFVNSLLVTSQPDPGIYQITGVAFFDHIHGSIGAASTAIEIHPILSISKK